MTYLEQVRKLQENKSCNIDEIWPILEEIKETLGPAEMWNIIEQYFSATDLLDVLEYICTETDI